MNLLSKFSKGFLAVAMFGALGAAAFTEGEDYVKLQKTATRGAKHAS